MENIEHNYVALRQQWVCGGKKAKLPTTLNIHKQSITFHDRYTQLLAVFVCSYVPRHVSSSASMSIPSSLTLSPPICSSISHTLILLLFLSLENCQYRSHRKRKQFKAPLLILYDIHCIRFQFSVFIFYVHCLNELSISQAVLNTALSRTTKRLFYVK